MTHFDTEKLSPEVGGEVVVNDPYGAGEIAVEMAVLPLADTGMCCVPSCFLIFCNPFSAASQRERGLCKPRGVKAE